jgi:hypothetical protein
MCNLYSVTRSQEAMRRLFRVHRDLLGNFSGLPGVFPDSMAPVVRTARDGERELTLMRWGFPRRRLPRNGTTKKKNPANAAGSRPHKCGNAQEAAVASPAAFILACDAARRGEEVAATRQAMVENRNHHLASAYSYPSKAIHSTFHSPFLEKRLCDITTIRALRSDSWGKK